MLARACSVGSVSEAPLQTWVISQTAVILIGLHSRVGAPEVHLAAAERALGLSFPPAMRVLYRVHDGQHLLGDAAADTAGACHLASPDMLRGLFGGCARSSQLLVCSQALVPAAEAPRQAPAARQGKTVLPACRRCLTQYWVHHAPVLPRCRVTASGLTHPQHRRLLR